MKLLAALFLLAGTATAAPVTLPVCADYAVERRGYDLVLTCPGPWRFYGPRLQVPAITVKGWYAICRSHIVSRTQAGVTIVCAGR